MSESNLRRVNRLIRFFHQSWTEKRQANLQLSTKDGDISIKLDLQLGRPEDIMPGPAAAGHPAGAPQRRRPRRHRGPAAKERSRQRAAAYHASRASSGAQTGASQASPGATRASHDAASASTQAVDQTQEALNSMLHPAPPPPPLGPTSTRLIKVVPRRTSHRSSFSQVDGQDNNSVDDSDCSSTVADEGGPPTASSPPLQPPPPHTPSDQVWQMLDRMPWGIPKCPPSGVCYIGHGALAHSEADKRKHRKSPYKSGDYPASNMNDQSVILQTCLDRRVIGATS